MPRTEDEYFAGAAKHGTNDNAKIVKPVMVSRQSFDGGGRGWGWDGVPAKSAFACGWSRERHEATAAPSQRWVPFF